MNWFYRHDGPTWVVASVLYAAWAMVIWFHQALTWWIVAPLGTYLVAWHFSLQHEAIHSFRSAPKWLRWAVVMPPLGLWLPFPLYYEAHRTHLVVEAMRRAYRDRTFFLGDPDFVDIPQEVLTSRDYAQGLRATIHPDKATPSDLLSGKPTPLEDEETTHFSIIDAEGNRVGGTQTVNLLYGSGLIPSGTGVLLNDEMDDFALKPGTPNAFGVMGYEANAPKPGKRMLSSMTPTFMESPEKVAVLGTPGGSRIITMVLLGILGYDAGLSAQQVAAWPR